MTMTGPQTRPAVAWVRSGHGHDGAPDTAVTVARTLIGRDEPRRRLRASLHRAELESLAVLVSGPAGIGKTAVLRDLAAASRVEGRQVGRGIAGAWAGARPLGPWEEALGQVGIEIDALTAAPGADGPPSTMALFSEVAEALRARVAIGPLTLLLEDLGQADETCIDLFAYLAERSIPGPLLLVASARPGCRGLDRLRVDRVDLGSWHQDDVAAAVAERGIVLDAEGVAALHARTGGNPLFVQRLLELPDPLADSVPRDIASLLVDQLDRLPASARRALDLLAVVGTRALQQLLADLVGDDPGSVLEPAISSGLVRVSADSIVFESPVVQEAAYTAIALDDRSLLHEAVAVALEHRATDPGRIAEHYARAARQRLGPRASEMARQAGTAAMAAGALPEAVRYFDQALTAARSGDGEDLPIVLDLVRALSFSRRMADAEALLLEAAARATADDDRRLILTQYTRLRWREEPNATVLRAHELYRCAEEWFGEAERPDLVVAREVAMVSAAEIEGITVKALGHAERALTTARSSGSDQLLAEAHLARRRALMVHHDSLAERRVDALAAVEAGERAGDGELVGRARRLACADAMGAGDRSAAFALMAPALASRSGALVEHVAMWRAGMAALEGRSVEAGAILASTRTELEASGIHSVVLEYVATAYAWDAGDLGRSIEQFESVLATVADPTLRAGLALAAVIDGQTDAARRHLDGAVEALLATEVDPLWLLGAGVAAEAAAALGDAFCADLYEVLAPYAGQCIVPAAAAVPYFGSVDRPLGLLCLRLGRLEEAEAHLRTSLEVHRSMRARTWEARSHAALALVLERAGRSSDAARHRRTGQRMQQDLGMGEVLLLGFDQDHAGTVSPPASTPGTDLREPIASQGTLRVVGDLWEVGLDDETGFTAPIVGLGHLARLLADEGRDWHVLDLAGVPGGTAAREGHGGEVIDDAARAAYRQRYSELSADLDQAETDADSARAEQARLELEALEAQLLQAYGLGGRSRRMDDPSERTRINVQRAIHRALARIEAVSPDLADHLRHRVHTGRFCRYEPDAAHPIAWRL